MATSVWLFAWLALAGMVGLVWLARLCAIGPILRRRRILSSTSYDGPPDNSPYVSVIVAAKDEQENIEACITWLTGQDYPSFEVIAVDDRSRDRTPDILARLVSTCGSSGNRIRVVTVSSVREGWFGKSNAMREGVAVSRGDWLLFTDADCRSAGDGSPRMLSMAMAEVLTHNVDFLSVTPILETHGVWERIIQPVCVLVLIFWFLPHRVNNSAKKTAYANGAFMLVRRSCYDRIGGHEGVKAEVNEDIHLAQRAKGAGLELCVVENEDLYQTRMYRSLSEAWRGWSRIFYGSLGSVPRLMTSAFLVSILVITPWISLVAAGLGSILVDAEQAVWWMRVAWAWLIVILLKQAVGWRVYSAVRVGRLWSLTYVLGAVAALTMLINAMLKALGATSTIWRGTTYRRGRLTDINRATTSDEQTDFGTIEEPATNV